MSSEFALSELRFQKLCFQSSTVLHFLQKSFHLVQHHSHRIQLCKVIHIIFLLRRTFFSIIFEVKILRIVNECDLYYRNYFVIDIINKSRQNHQTTNYITSQLTNQVSSHWKRAMYGEWVLSNHPLLLIASVDVWLRLLQPAIYSYLLV